MQSLFLILRNPRYFAPAWIFASVNIIVSTWVLYVPRVKIKLGLDDGQLGVALFSFSLGMLTVIPLSSFLLKRFGLGRLTLCTIVGFALAMTLPVLATSYSALIVTLFGCGMLVSLNDIGMNALVSEIELRDGAHFMSAAHGFFSLGGVLGAGIGSLLLPFIQAPVYHFLGVAAVIGISNLILSRYYWREKSRASARDEGGSFQFSHVRPLLGLTVLAIIVMGSEGAIEHWSKLYLLDVVNLDSDVLAGYGFVLFSAAMTFGRFLGDGVSDRFGSLTIVIGGSLLGAVGYGLVLTAVLWLTLLGFTLVGLGFSVIIPELFRLAGRAPGISSAEGISVVAGLGYFGFLASPALLGFLSDLGTLRLSFTFLLAVVLSAALLAFYLKRKGRYARE